MEKENALAYEFNKLATPLIQWLNNNFHPHTKIIIDQTGAELLEGSYAIYTEEHLVD